MRELAEQCDMKPGNVNHKAVEQLMLADKEGGPQFKRLFLVLLESALIEPSTCGMIKTKIGEIIDDLDNVRNINWCSYTIFVLKFAMGNWSKTEKNAFAGPLPFLMIPDDCAVGSSLNLLPKDYIQEEQQQGNEEKSLDVNESGVGSSSQNILPSHMVANLVKYIKQINDGRTNLVRVLKEVSSQIKNNDLFGFICDIARSAIGSQKSPVASAIEQRNKDNLPTSPVGDPEEVRQTVEEDEQRKENMICDDDNESDSPISTAVLGSPRTASLSIQQQEVNASEHDNTLASLIGSENSGNELEIQEEVEADRELTTQDALHILSKVCGDYEISNNEEAIKATNTIVDIINEQEDREDTAACSIVEYMMQEGIETMDDTPPECNVQKQGYRGKETMHEEKEKTSENAERRMTVYQILRGRYCEAMLTSRSNKKYMDMVRVADDWMIANKHRLPELQNKFKEWFSCRSKKEKWKSNVPFMRDLAEQCDTKPANVNHKAVEQLMLADQEGGPQFKRLFLVLLESALIEPSTCGMIKSKIGEIVDDLDNVRNINWCSYTISVLKFAMENWSKTEKNAFAGPLPFLIIELYKTSVLSSVGSQTTTIEAVNEKCQLLSKMFEEDKPETFDRWKTISESILLAQKEKEALEDLAEFPTFKTPRFLDKYAEQGYRENIPTSPVSDPKGAAEEGEVEGTKEDTVVDDSNESASPILPPAAGQTDDAYNFNVTNRPDNWDGSTAKKNFISQIDNEIQRRPDFNWREIDLVFFPVCANFHYYLVVYWVKKNTIEVIDNNKPHKAMDPFEKYDIDIGLMKDMFEAYFIEKKILDISENVNKSSINFLPLEWATSTNNKDCGVYLMRHMETYVGKKGSEWDIGFSGRSVKIPQILRGRYCYTMISSIYNNQRSPMLQLAHDWMEANMEKLLELNNKYKELFSRRKK
ncbi:hypothetical protein SASPL_128966 [Salvia splendens]|uniref:Ubiquitin-like protease family profile domain-containing protein n=1 Tax=Salvia splendens TaxID=180675 RepID=A0A8X8ZN98_SALSN|nr:hypothetical protein SASPL_128966 [Salvia splendens]